MKGNSCIIFFSPEWFLLLQAFLRSQTLFAHFFSLLFLSLVLLFLSVFGYFVYCKALLDKCVKILHKWNWCDIQTWNWDSEFHMPVCAKNKHHPLFPINGGNAAESYRMTPPYEFYPVKTEVMQTEIQMKVKLQVKKGFSPRKHQVFICRT